MRLKKNAMTSAMPSFAVDFTGSRVSRCVELVSALVAGGPASVLTRHFTGGKEHN